LESALLSTQMRVEGISQLNNTLRGLDRKAINRLRADMRGSVMPIAKAIAGDVPPEAPLSGMMRSRMKYGGSPVNGVTRWTGQPKSSVQFTPGRARGGASRILAMRFTGGTRAGGGIGFDYAELAGSSRRPGARFSRVYERNGIPGLQHAINGQGRAFNEGIRNARPIKGRGGFFAYDSAVKRYPQIEGLGKRAIDAFMADATRELQRIRGAM
jgi:hypothetical protein